MGPKAIKIDSPAGLKGFLYKEEMDCQDWETVKIQSKKQAAPQIETRPAATTGSQEAARLRKLEQSEYVKPKMLSAESRTVLVQMRVGMKKNQTELNQLCCFPVNTIKEIEAGRLCPTTSQLNTLNRVLKTSLKLA